MATYRVRITDSRVGPKFVRDGLDWDGSWATRQEADAKTWKTQRGAQRWIDERSGIAAVVEEC